MTRNKESRSHLCSAALSACVYCRYSDKYSFLETMVKFELSQLHKRSRADRNRVIKRIKDRRAKGHREHVRVQTLTGMLARYGAEASRSSASSSSRDIKQEVKVELQEIKQEVKDESQEIKQEVKVERQEIKQEVEVDLQGINQELQEKKNKKQKSGGKRKAERLHTLEGSLDDDATTSVARAQANEELQAIRFLRAGNKKKRARRRHQDNCGCPLCAGKRLEKQKDA